MNLKATALAAAFAASMLGLGAPVPAKAIGGAGALKAVGAAQQSTVAQAHFWHRTCRRGLHGWHKHVKGVGRVECTTHICRHGKCRWY